MRERVALTDQLHGLLGEFAIVLPRGTQALLREHHAAARGRVWCLANIPAVPGPDFSE
jgi:hypothetical protein